jgi:predicted dehydrogenase
MSAQPLKVAIIGAGLIGPRHALSIISNPSTHLIALVEPSPTGPSIAASLHTAHYTSLSSLLSSEHKPDAAIVCTPNHTHVSLSLECIDAGVHALVEKPISTSVEDGRRLVERAREKGVRLLVGHHRRFNPYLLSAKSCLSSNSLGKIIAVQGTWCLLKPASYFQGLGSWRQSSEKGGGVVLINLIHEVDLLQYLLGPITLVSALETNKMRGYEAEEGAAILMRFESGVVGTFLLSDAVPSPWNFEAGTGENPMIPRVEGAEGFYRIFGTEGSLSVPDLKKWSYGGEKEKGWNLELEKEELGVDREKVPFDAQVQHFVDVVRGGVEPSCSGEEALRALVVCEAVVRAMGTGMPVEIRGFDIVEKKAAV